jgi:hypothetical protein
MRNGLAGNRLRRRRGRSGLLGGSLSRRLSTTVVAASPDSWAGHGVLLVPTPDAEVERLVVLLVCAGKFDGRARGAVAATGDLDLSASAIC